MASLVILVKPYNFFNFFYNAKIQKIIILHVGFSIVYVECVYYVLRPVNFEGRIQFNFESNFIAQSKKTT